MSNTRPLSGEITAIVHATEDPQRVQAALLSVMPESFRGRFNVHSRKLEGHYGNPITVLTVNVSGSSLTHKLLEFLASQLSVADKASLATRLSTQIDSDGNLFIRVDKQAALDRRLLLRKDDPIKIRVKFAASSDRKQMIDDYCRGVGLVI